MQTENFVLTAYVLVNFCLKASFTFFTLIYMKNLSHLFFSGETEIKVEKYLRKFQLVFVIYRKICIEILKISLVN